MKQICWDWTQEWNLGEEKKNCQLKNEEIWGKEIGNWPGIRFKDFTEAFDSCHHEKLCFKSKMNLIIKTIKEMVRIKCKNAKLVGDNNDKYEN